jgi:hypothetical protein
MANKQGACVIVSSEWVQIAPIRQMLGIARAAADGADTHILISDITDRDSQGVWLRGIVTTAIVDKDTQEPTKMDFLVPWQYVVGLGLWDERAKSAAGFQTNATQMATSQPSA